MAIVKANYVRRGRGEKDRAKATIRYIAHRRGVDGERTTRTLFGFDGQLTNAQVYRMIDEAPRRGMRYYRIVISPDPKREDRLKDLSLEEITIETMLALEERLGRRVQFAAAIHDDHSPHRHVHTLVLIHGRRLTRKDFLALRHEATKRALTQRRQRDQALGLQRTPIRTPRTRLLFEHRGRRRFSQRGARPFQGYTCPLCGFYQLLPYAPQGYRCPADGLFLRRDHGQGLVKMQRRGVGLSLGH